MLTSLQKPEILAALLREPDKSTTDQETQAPTQIVRMQRARLARLRADDDHVSGLADNGTSFEAKIPELTDEQTLIVSGHLHGYSLREGKWGRYMRSMPWHQCY